MTEASVSREVSPSFSRFHIGAFVVAARKPFTELCYKLLNESTYFSAGLYSNGSMKCDIQLVEMKSEMKKTHRSHKPNLREPSAQRTYIQGLRNHSSVVLASVCVCVGMCV